MTPNLQRGCRNIYVSKPMYNSITNYEIQSDLAGFTETKKQSDDVEFCGCLSQYPAARGNNPSVSGDVKAPTQEHAVSSSNVASQIAPVCSLSPQTASNGGSIPDLHETCSGNLILCSGKIEMPGCVKICNGNCMPGCVKICNGNCMPGCGKICNGNCMPGSGKSRRKNFGSPGQLRINSTSLRRFNPGKTSQHGSDLPTQGAERLFTENYAQCRGIYSADTKTERQRLLNKDNTTTHYETFAADIAKQRHETFNVDITTHPRTYRDKDLAFDAKACISVHNGNSSCCDNIGKNNAPVVGPNTNGGDRTLRHDIVNDDNRMCADIVNGCETTACHAEFEGDKSVCHDTVNGDNNACQGTINGDNIWQVTLNSDNTLQGTTNFESLSRHENGNLTSSCETAATDNTLSHSGHSDGDKPLYHIIAGDDKKSRNDTINTDTTSDNKTSHSALVKLLNTDNPLNNGIHRTNFSQQSTCQLNQNTLPAGKYVSDKEPKKCSDDVRPGKTENEAAVEKKNFTEEMLAFIRRNFPNIHSAVYQVPPQRFNKVQEEKLKEYGSPIQDVFLQRESAHSDVRGDSTDDVVIQCVSHVLSATSVAAFVLHNYFFDDYLCKNVREAYKQRTRGDSLSFTSRCKESGRESKCSNNYKSQSNYLQDPNIQKGVKTGRNQKQKQTSAKGHSQNPKDVFFTPRNLSNGPIRGDFDCLILSPTFGFIVLESKTLDPFERFIKQGECTATSAHNTLVHCRNNSDTTLIDNETKRQDDGNNDKTDYFRSTDDVRVQIDEGERVSTGNKNFFAHDIFQTNNNKKTTNFLPNFVSHHSAISSESEPGVFEGGQEVTPTSEYKRLKENASDAQTTYYAGEIETFRRKIREAMSQLNKAEMVLRHLVSDLTENVPITKTLALPNMGRNILRQVLDDPNMKSEICTCLKVATLEDVLLRCLCAEEAKVVSDNFHKDIENSNRITPTTNSLTAWWAELTRSIENGLYSKARGKSDDISREQSSRNEIQDLPKREILPYDAYEQIIARFCGPYSKASIGHRQGAKDEIRTAEDSIHLTGVRFGRSILRSEQKDILDSDDRFVIIVGPPGAGKTLILALKAMEWAKKGDHVVVICKRGVNYGSLVSWILYNRVKDVMKQTEKDKITLENKGNNNHEKFEKNEIQSKRGVDDNTIAESNEKFETSSIDHKEERIANYTSREDKEDRGLRFEAKAKETEDDKKPLPVYAENVHCERFSVETDVDEFVQNLLVKYGDKPLRLIVDEVPRKVTRESQLQKLSQCLSKLQDIDGLYNKLLKVLQDGAVRVYISDCQTQVHTEEKGDNRYGECHSTGNVLHHGTLLGDTLKHGVCLGNAFTAQHSVFQHNTLHTGCSAELCTTTEDRSQHDTRKGDEDQHRTRTEDRSQHDTRKGDEDQHRTRTGDRSQHDTRKGDDQHRTRTGDTSQEETRTGDKDEYSTCRGNLYRNPDTHLGGVDIQHTLSNSLSAQQSGTSLKLHSDKQRLHALGSNTSNTYTPEQTEEQRLESEEKGFLDHPYFLSRKYLTRMESYIVSLSARIQQLQTDNGTARVLLGDLDWENSLAHITVAFLKVKDRKLECDKRISEMTGWGTVRCEELTGLLEEIDKAMISAMGFAFNAYAFLAFFVIQAFFNRIVEKYKSDPSREISLWSSCVFTFQIPAEMKEKKLTTCIRCPPNVQQVMSFIGEKLKILPNIDLITTGAGVNPPLPTAGPRVKFFNHSQHIVQAKEIHDCKDCGTALADFLLDHLNVGKPGSKLAVHDVVITGSPIHQTAQCAFIQVLIARGFTVQYENQTLTTPPPYQDKVLVIGGSSLQGLEAKIVVYVPEVRRVLEAKCSEEPSDPTPVQDIRQCLSRLDDWNLQYLWTVASRTVSLLTIFHI